MLISVNMDDVCARPWEYAVEPFKVVEGVYYVGNSWVAIYLIDTGEGLILIDTAMPQTVYLTLEAIRKLGYDPHDIKLILLSHAHYDHIGGAALLSHYTGAEIYMGKEDMFILKERQDLIHVSNGWFNDFDVDSFYDEEHPIELGNIKIYTRHCPGHTPGSYSFFFNVEEDGNVYRCAMHGGIGVNSLTEDYLNEMGLPISLQDDFENNLMQMRKEKVDIVLGSHTNHGDILGKSKRIGKGINPFIDSECFKSLIDSRYEDFLKHCNRKDRKF